MVNIVSNFKIAATYATAIYELAADENCLEAVYDDMCTLAKLEKPTFNMLQKIDNPLVKSTQKEDLIALFSHKLQLHTQTQNMLKLMVEHHKMFALEQIVTHFLELYDKKHNIAKVTVTTVIKPNAAQEKNLIKVLTAMAGKKISLRYIINPNIIGGLIIEYETYLIDLSILHKLNCLEQVMKGSK